jgi:hypothetical protein
MEFVITNPLFCSTDPLVPIHKTLLQNFYIVTPVRRLALTTVLRRFFVNIFPGEEFFSYIYGNKTV